MLFTRFLFLFLDRLPIFDISESEYITWLKLKMQNIDLCKSLFTAWNDNVLSVAITYSSVSFLILFNKTNHCDIMTTLDLFLCLAVVICDSKSKLLSFDTDMKVLNVMHSVSFFSLPGFKQGNFVWSSLLNLYFFFGILFRKNTKNVYLFLQAIPVCN